LGHPVDFQEVSSQESIVEIDLRLERTRAWAWCKRKPPSSSFLRLRLIGSGHGFAQESQAVKGAFLQWKQGGGFFVRTRLNTVANIVPKSGASPAFQR